MVADRMLTERENMKFWEREKFLIFLGLLYIWKAWSEDLILLISGDMLKNSESR